MKKKLWKGFLPIVLALMLVFGTGTIAAFADEPAEDEKQPAAYEWTVYSGETEVENEGLVFRSSGETYGFSATSDGTVKARELALNLRIRGNVFTDNAHAEILIGLMGTKGDFTAEEGNYGIMLQSTAENVYKACLVISDGNGGYKNIDSVSGVTLSSSGTLSILVHREAATRWMIMMNGWAIDNNAGEKPEPGEEPELPGDEPAAPDTEPAAPGEPQEPQEPELPGDEPAVADPDNITEEEQAAIDAWQSKKDAYDTWETEHAAWETEHAAWETEHAAWETEHDAWQAIKDAHDAWQSKKDAYDTWETEHAAWETEHAAWETEHAAWETEHDAWQAIKDAYDTWQSKKDAHDTWQSKTDALAEWEADADKIAAWEANRALEAMDDVYLSIAARDTSGGEDQTMQVELYQANGVMLGMKNDAKATFTNNTGNHETPVTPDYTADGVAVTGNSGQPELRVGITDKLSGSLDGYVMSVVVDPAGIPNYTIDLGVGTVHGAGRFTFWDSYQDKPAPCSSLGVRVTSDNDIVFLMLKGGNPVEMETFNGAIKFAPRADGRITVGFNKVGENWKVYVNGREIPGHNAGATVFQDLLNRTLEVMNAVPNPESVSPWIMSYVNQNPDGENFKFMFTGYGTRALGVITDENEGNVADNITGELEFSKNQWTNNAPGEYATVNYRITDDGFYAGGINRTTGFSVGLCYNRNLGDINGFTATIKLPEKVKQTSGNVHGFYGMYIGSTTNRNFTEQDSLLIRFTFANEDPTLGGTVQMIHGDFLNGAAGYVDGSSFVDPKTEEGKEDEYTIHIAYHSLFKVYRIYANGQRVSNEALEKAITATFNKMEQKYFYLMGSYEEDGVGGAFGDNDNEEMHYTLVSVNGNKIVNKVAEEVQTIELGNATDITSSSATLTWTKAQYPVGEMDSHNFTPTHYVIERIKGDDEDPEATITVEGDIDTLTYTDSGLDADTDYYYTVYAADANGNKLMRSNKNKRVVTLAASGNGNGDGNGDGNGGGSTDNGNETGESDAKKKKCGSTATGASGAAAVLMLGLSAAVIATKKKRA